MKKDISTKLISLLFAIFMWFYIIQVQSPDIEKTVKAVPVQFTKGELEEQGLMLINDKEVEVSVKVRGQRKYLTGIKKEDITVVADVSKIETTGTHNVYTNVVLPYGNIELVEQKPSYISVTVDEIVEEEKEIVINTVGSPKNGYVVGDIKAEPKKAKVKGPKSIVKGIEKLSADVNVSGKEEDISTIQPLYFVGTSDTVLNTPYVTLETETVDVHCEILKKKTVDISVRFAEGINSSREYYIFDNNSVKSIEVAGTAAAIEELQSVTTKLVTKKMISESGEVEVELSLPAGIKSLDGDKLTLKLKKVHEGN